MNINRSADVASPHADKPVDRWPWSAEAFEEARRRDAPTVLLSSDRRRTAGASRLADVVALNRVALLNGIVRA